MTILIFHLPKQNYGELNKGDLSGRSRPLGWTAFTAGQVSLELKQVQV